MKRFAISKSYPFFKEVLKYKKRYLLGLSALVLVDLINVLFPIVLKNAIDELELKKINGVYLAAAAYLLLTLLQSVGRYLWRTYLTGTSHLIAQDYRVALNRQLQKIPLKDYQNIRTGDLMSRATNDVESIRMAVGPGILVALDSVFLFAMIVPVMFWMSVKLSLLTFALYPLVPPITYYLGERIDKLFESLQTKMSQMGAFAQECFSGIRVLKTLVLENHSLKRFLGLSEAYQKEAIQLSKYEAVFSPSLSFITNMGTLLILIVGGLDVLEGTITLGTYIAFQRFVVQLSWPMEAIGWAITMNREGFAAKRRIDEILNLPKVQNIRIPVGQASSHNLFESVDKTGIDSFSMGAGEKIGLVGATGSGKSSFFQSVIRLTEPTPGTLFLEGKDIVSIPLNELRHRIATVEQQVFLFNETILYNLTLGIPTPPPMEEIKKACGAACILKEIERLPNGFETLIGERGITLSGGQKQRIALARALLRKPALLLLDDCFSAVDVEVEAQVIERVLRAYPDTAFMIASHRLSIMKKVDRVLILEKGRQVAYGAHPELLKQNPFYRELVEKSERLEEKEKFILPLEEVTL